MLHVAWKYLTGFMYCGRLRRVFRITMMSIFGRVITVLISAYIAIVPMWYFRIFFRIAILGMSTVSFFFVKNHMQRLYARKISLNPRRKSIQTMKMKKSYIAMKYANPLNYITFTLSPVIAPLTESDVTTSATERPKGMLISVRAEMRSANIRM